MLSAKADILVLLDFDYDLHGRALGAFAKLISSFGGVRYSQSFSLMPNTGVPTGLDLDGDGRTGTPRDAQGYGEFSGQGGMAILSRFPILTDEVEDYSHVLWSDYDWADLPIKEGALFPSESVLKQQRLSTTGHWIVPIALSDGSQIRLGVFHATPPAFDGPEDRNGKRNADEVRFWSHYLKEEEHSRDLIIVGGANLDPVRGDGRREVIADLLSEPNLHDPFPSDTLTVDWSDLGLGHMRTDYILPSRAWSVEDSGTIWPAADDENSGRHALIWVDLLVNVPISSAMLELSPSNE